MQAIKAQVDFRIFEMIIQQIRKLTFVYGNLLFDILKYKDNRSIWLKSDFVIKSYEDYHFKIFYDKVQQITWEEYSIFLLFQIMSLVLNINQLKIIAQLIIVLY